MSIGDLLKMERIKNHMSQEDVAKAIGSTKQAVYKYENGIVTNIPMDKIETMAKLFGTTPAYLMGWEESKKLNLQLFAENKNPTATYDGISEKKRELIELAMTVSEEEADRILQVMKLVVGDK